MPGGGVLVQHAFISHLINHLGRPLIGFSRSVLVFTIDGLLCLLNMSTNFGTQAKIAVAARNRLFRPFFRLADIGQWGLPPNTGSP